MRGRSRPRTLVGVIGPTAGSTAGVLAFAAGAVGCGVEVHVGVVALLGATLGFVASPPVRLALERRSAGTGGLLSLSFSAVLISALMALLGLSVLVPAVSTSVAVYAVLVAPTRRRVLESAAVVLVTSAAALGAQLAGWVDGLVPDVTACLLTAASLAFAGPTVTNVANVSRRADRAAQALEKERATHLADLEHAARHDSLTGLLGRRGILEPLQKAALDADVGSITAVLFIDLDGFKSVNDRHGHAAGDELLVVVAQRMRACVRERDFLARTGGDEFVIVLPGLTDEVEAREVADRLREAVEHDVKLCNGEHVRVGASTGVVTTSEPRDAESMLSEADAAMYEAKRSGRTSPQTRPAEGSRPGKQRHFPPGHGHGLTGSSARR